MHPSISQCHFRIYDYIRSTMESARVNADWVFFKKQPYGQMMGLQMVLALILVLLPFFAPFRYEGISFVHSCAVSLFVLTLVMNLFHVFGWNRRVIPLSAGINLFVPCTLIVFGVSVVFFFLFVFNTLIALIGFFDSFRFTITMIFIYAMICCASAAETLVCFRLSVLLFRAAPNSQLLGLTTVIIDGDGTSRMEGSVPQFSPATSPTGPTGPAAV